MGGYCPVGNFRNCHVPVGLPGWNQKFALAQCAPIKHRPLGPVGRGSPRHSTHPNSWRGTLALRWQHPDVPALRVSTRRRKAPPGPHRATAVGRGSPRHHFRRAIMAGLAPPNCAHGSDFRPLAQCAFATTLWVAPRTRSPSTSPSSPALTARPAPRRRVGYRADTGRKPARWGTSALCPEPTYRPGSSLRVDSTSARY